METSSPKHINMKMQLNLKNELKTAEQTTYIWGRENLTEKSKVVKLIKGDPRPHSTPTHRWEEEE